MLDALNRYRTLVTDRIYSLPVVIMMPHSACNCRCIMCDIWQDNKNLKQLHEEDVQSLLAALKKFRTRVVVMSGGEALLNRNFFKLCEIIRGLGIRITLLSTGLGLKQHAENILKHNSEVIVSLDGPEAVHDLIRRVPNAYQKLAEGVRHLKNLNPGFRVTARSVIQAQNFRDWAGIVDSAKALGLDQVSFLAADVSSPAFNRELQWDQERKAEVLPLKEELPELEAVLKRLVADYAREFSAGFIAESPARIRNIYVHYAATHGLMAFPRKECNAPWVSAVIEADGTVRHCFFLETAGNIRQQRLDDILNGDRAVDFRKSLDTATNEVCAKCVCSLRLSPLKKV